MKLGVFCNINGNYSRLEKIMQEMSLTNLKYIFCLGNLISDTKSIETEDRQDDIKCLDILERYREYFDSLGSDLKDEYSLFSFMGRNEYLFLKAIELNNRTNDKMYRRVLDNHYFRKVYFYRRDATNRIDGIFVLMTNPQGTILTKESVIKMLKETGREINRLDLVESPYFKVLFIGHADHSRCYELHGNKLIYRKEKKITLGDGRTFVISPSSKDAGYTIVDGNLVNLLF